MDFQWTETQATRYEDAVAFGKDALRGSSLGGDVSMKEIWSRFASAGATGLTIPKEYGGSGLSALEAARVLEGLGYGAGTMGHLFGLCAHLFGAGAPLIRFGSDEQKNRWLPGLASGELIGALAMTESGAGSSPAEMACSAVSQDGGYALSGEKRYVTNAPYADLFLLTASTAPERGGAGLSSFLVSKDSPGLSVSPPARKMGLYPTQMATVTLESCVAPLNSLLASESRGADCFGEAMLWERALILAPRIGALRHHLDACVQYARTRKQGGRRIGHYQGVSHRIAKMAVKISAAQTLLYRAAWSVDNREDASSFAAMAKHFISEVAVEAHLDIIQVFGGSGYLEDTGVEVELRDAVGGLIHSGTAEIQLNIIASHLGL